jgi:hypothetical protein
MVFSAASNIPEGTALQLIHATHLAIGAASRFMGESGVRAGGQRVIVATSARLGQSCGQRQARIVKSGIQFGPSDVINAGFVGNSGTSAYQVENPSFMRRPVGVVMEEVQNDRVATDPNFRIVNPGRLPRHSPMKGETRWPT